MPTTDAGAAQLSGAGFSAPLQPTPPSVNLVVATPCFGGQISVVYAASLMKLQKLVRSYRDFSIKTLFKDGDALITRARASLVAQFLDDPSATHLLFIDADIGFEPQQVLRLIECGADMCAAVYPIKRIDWDKVKDTLAAGRPNPAAAALQYVFEVDDPNAVTEKAGFHQSPLCRHRPPDDPARGVRTYVRALSGAALQARPFARCRDRKRQPLRFVRHHDRRRRECI